MLFAIQKLPVLNAKSISCDYELLEIKFDAELYSISFEED